MQPSIEYVLQLLEKDFKNDPLKFFNEKDLHFMFMEHLYSQPRKSMRELNVVREYPLKPVRGPRKRAVPHIDIVIETRERKAIMGLEFFLGKSLMGNGFVIHKGRRYFVRKSDFSLENFKWHADGDMKKLRKIKKMNEGLIVCFFVTNYRGKKLDSFNKKIEKCRSYLEEKTRGTKKFRYQIAQARL